MAYPKSARGSVGDTPVPGAPRTCYSYRIWSMALQLPEPVRLAYSHQRGCERTGVETSPALLHARLLGRLHVACCTGKVVEGFEYWGGPNMARRRKDASYGGCAPMRPHEL